MNIAYVRVSSIEQNEARQLEALKKFNIEKIFSEKVSAKNTERPKLKEMLEFCREGDTIYIHDFSRLARSTEDLLNLVKYLNNKNVNIVSIKENVDSSTATGKLMLTMIGAINTFERENLLERQREGIAIAKEKGVYKGRKKIKKPSNWDVVYNDYIHRRITAVKAMELTGLKKSTFYKFLNEEKRINEVDIK